MTNVRSTPPCQEKSVEASALIDLHWSIPYPCWRLTYGPTSLCHRLTPPSERGIIDAAPASLRDETPRNDEELPLGDKTPRTKEELHLLASAATLTPPQLPLWDETPRNNPLASAASLTLLHITLGDETPRNKEDLLLGDKTLGTKEELPLGDETPGATTTTTPNLRRCGQKAKTTRKQEHTRTRIMDTARTMETTTTTKKTTPNLQG